MNGQDFKNWRADMGFTQAQAAEAIGRTKSTVAEYEAGQSDKVIDPNVETVCRVLTIARRGMISSKDPEMAALFLDAQARLAAAAAVGNRQSAAGIDPAVYAFMASDGRLHPSRRARLEPVVGGYEVSLIERGVVLERSGVLATKGLAEMYIHENAPPGYHLRPASELPAQVRKTFLMSPNSEIN